MSLQNTTVILSELNNLLLGQYPFENRPKVKAEYYLTKNGKLSDYSFKEYWERLLKATAGFRGDILMIESPEKIPLVKILIDLLNDNILLLTTEKNEYAQYIRDTSKELLRWLRTRIPEQVKPKMNVPIFALYVYYLQRGKHIDGTQIYMINEIKKKTGIKFKTESIANYFRNITQKNNKDPLTPDNLRKVIELLDLYPKAKERAEQDLSELIL